MMMLLLPAILHRIEDYLIALEACALVGLDISPELALEAVTKDSDNTEDHGETQINFKKGMGQNYERLEFLGDCFLKMATSISLFVLQEKSDEFEFHVDRMVLVCNKNLFNTAVKLKLYEYIRSQSFNRAEWYPHGLTLLKGKGKGKTNDLGDHTLGDKTIADVCEALIGAAFLEHNQPDSPWRPEHWDNAVHAVTAFTSSEKHAVHCWNEYHAGYSKPEYQTASSTASQLDMAAKVETEHDYHFNHPRLLRSAFVHPSQPFGTERVPNYQRLEFLGDALLDMTSVSYLFYQHPDRDPQWLTEHKMAMVSNKFLGAVSVRLGFHRHLRHTHSILEKQIRDYVADVQDAEREAEGAADYWTSVKSPPKCLPDIVEAYVGALFIDSGFDFGQVQRFFDQHIKPYFVDMSIYDTFANDHPTIHLHNLLGTTMGCRDYRLLAREMPTIDAAIGAGTRRCMAAVMVHDHIIADGTSSGSKYAKIKACVAALEKLDGLAPFEFRARFGCDCKAKGEEVEVNASEESEELEFARIADAAREKMDAVAVDTAV
jgi:endoribonuclease Dicer